MFRESLKGLNPISEIKKRFCRELKTGVQDLCTHQSINNKTRALERT
ncbi:unnamed protein product [Moneuplotes crassus]|uniref:Uncharacterized protein n=1 Tax=Euplotes crassus TaxID=5936 RepID=A0AAD1XF45_EUPCR|nr:unnamed protein product [Moneuplotes crassus]